MTLAKWTNLLGDFSIYWTIVPGDLHVTVAGANEPPVITGSNARTFRENGTGTIYTYRATDPERDEFTWIEPDGADGHLFDISERGALTFMNPPDFDRPNGSGENSNDYMVTVQARDDQNNTGTFEVTVTVTDVNEGPEVTGRETISVQEYTDPNQDPALQTLATYSATDPEGSDISRWSLSGSDGGDFLISETGALTFRNIPDYDRPVDSNRGQRISDHRTGLRCAKPVRYAGRDSYSGQCQRGGSGGNGESEPEFQREHYHHDPPLHLSGHRYGPRHYDNLVGQGTARQQ